MNWAEIQAQVGVASANAQLAMLASFRRDEAAMVEALAQVEKALKRVEELRRAEQS